MELQIPGHGLGLVPFKESHISGGIGGPRMYGVHCVIIANIKPVPERVVHRGKEYLRHPGVRAAEAPSLINLAGEAGI
jgi:hypothetical protein